MGTTGKSRDKCQKSLVHALYEGSGGAVRKVLVRFWAQTAKPDLGRPLGKVACSVFESSMGSSTSIPSANAEVQNASDNIGISVKEVQDKTRCMRPLMDTPLCTYTTLSPSAIEDILEDEIRSTRR